MLTRLTGLIIKEFIQTLRDPKMRAVIVMMPLLQSLVFGYAVTTDVTRIPTVVHDRDSSFASRKLVDSFTSSGYFRVVDYVRNEEDVKSALDRDRADLALRVPEGFSQALKGKQTADLQVIVNGTNSNTAGIILDYVSSIIHDINRDITLERLGTLENARPPNGQVELVIRSWFNPNLQSRWYYVPGVIALIVMLVTLMLGSMSIVRERERGTMEQILVSPLRQFEFILGKLIPVGLIGLFDVFLITAIAGFWFEIPIRGNFLFLLGATLLFLLSTLGLGLLISTVSRTQQQAMIGTFFVYFPAVLLSGFMFPIPNMPEPVQWITFLNPLRYFLTIVRNVFLKGLGGLILWPQLLGLLVLGVLLVAVSINRTQESLQ